MAGVACPAGPPPVPLGGSTACSCALSQPAIASTVNRKTPNRNIMFNITRSPAWTSASRY
jgi:hypothetical protein